MGIVEVFSCVYKVEWAWSRTLLIAGRDFSLFKPACPKMAARVIKNRRIRWFPQGPDLSERSLVFPTLGLKQRLYLFEDPYASDALVRFCLLLVVHGWLFVCFCFLHFSSLVVDSAGKEVARKTHLLFSFIASEVSCSDYLIICEASWRFLLFSLLF